MADRRDYVALEWVKGEIQETLKQAQYALEAFVETPDDTNRLEFSLAYLHQVHGTLQMVEFFGAALLAEEMELLNQAFVDGKAPAHEDNLAVLMQAIIQLPSYLDRIKQGQHDIPIVILPLLNDLRATRGETLLSETSLFSPDLAAARRLLGEPDYSAFIQPKTSQLISKLRQMFQLALVGWLKGQDQSSNIEFLAKSVSRIAKLTERTQIGVYWQVVEAFVVAIQNEMIERSPATAQVLRNVDRSYRALLKEPLETVQNFASDQQLKNLLFYLAKLGQTNVDRIDKIQRLFKLLEALPSDQDVETQRAKLAGPDREAVSSVVAALLEELSRLKDALDVMVRTQVKEPTRLDELTAPLQQLSDAMSVVGLKNPQRVLNEQLESIATLQKNGDSLNDGQLMDIAGALLYVEATLTGLVSDATMDLASVDANASIEQANEAVLREARTGIEQVKEAIVEFIGSHFDAARLEGTSKILSGVRGGLMIVPLNDAGRILQAIQSYIDDKLVGDNYRPQWHEMDLLADALVGVEYYLERLTRDGGATGLEILKRAAQSLEQLGMTVIITGNNHPEKQATETVVESSAELDELSLNESQSPAEESSLAEEPEVEEQMVEAVEVQETSGIALLPDVDSQDTSLVSDDPNATVIDWDDSGSDAADESLDFLDSDIEINEAEWDETPAVEFEEVEEPQIAYLEPEETLTPITSEEPLEADFTEVEIEAPQQEEPVPVIEASVEEEDDDDLIDDEILEIFIEEAAEVLEAINEFYPKYKQDENDEASLTEFRRAYHTMKGSGRMVGATIVGETAWSVENMLNRLIDGTIHRSDDLLRIVEEVTAELPQLVKAFEDKRKPDSRRADALAEIAHAISKGEPANWSLVDSVEEPVTEPEPEPEPEPASQAEAEPEIEEIEAEQVAPAPVAEIEPEIELENLSAEDIEDIEADLDLDSNDNLLKVFKTELKSHLEFVEQYINDSPLGAKLPDALQRALHTIKGSAHMASMEIIAEPVTPVEAIVKDLQERGQLADEAFILLLTDLVSLVTSYSDVEPGTASPEAVQKFVERAKNYRNREQTFASDDSQDDVSLMNIFLSQSMDIVMDAEHLLEQWRSTGQSRSASETLIRELDILSQAAQAVDLMPLSQLSNELRSLYIAAEGNPFIVEEKFFDLAHDGQESLISMMDRLAAGQSIRADALFTERLSQLLNLHSIAIDIPKIEPVDPVDVPEVIELEEQAAPAIIEEEPQPLPMIEVELGPGERFHLDGDADLVEIFLEEANDILESTQRSLEGWLVDTDNTREVEGLQRDLHTLKGGARMAEISPLGDLAHELEFLYEGLGQGKYQASDGLITLLQQCHDRLAEMVGDIESSMTCAPAPDLVDAINRFRANPGEPLVPVTLKPVEEPQPVPPSAEVVEEVPVQEADKTASETRSSDSPVNLDASLPEDVDLDILEIFIDEAGELLNELENAVEEWRSGSESETQADELKRVLHTLKGGARLAKLKDLADASHEFETFVIKAQQNKRPQDAEFFAEILARQDQLVTGVESLQQMLEQHGAEGGFGPSVIQIASEMDDSEIEQITEADLQTPKLETVQQPEPEPNAPGEEKSDSTNVVPFKSKAPVEVEGNAAPDAKASQTGRRAQPQETIKVNADLLEGLVNLAGETSISRSRLEQEVSDFGFTLSDMDQTIDRLRDHVRRLDMETEAQILFRQERAEETNYEDFDPLEMDRYSQIQQLSRSLMETAYDLQDLKSTLTDKTRDAETILLQQSRINTELQEGLMRTRMVQFNRLLPRLRRIVRQVSGELGKQIDFVIGNAEGEVDRAVLERMISPLEHLLRNAVDHGIEMPEVRSAKGKATQGIIRLDLSREGSDIVLRLEDDGKGLDVGRIRERAVERGLMLANSDLNDSEVMQFILEAGFSTAEKVTQISGRGVGMDVVNSEVKQLGGTIVIESEFNRGTLFTIRLPFTVSVNRALMVNVLDDLYALPLTSIEGIVRVTPKQLTEYYKPDAPMFEYGGSSYRLEYMGALLHTDARPNLAGIEQSVPLVLVRGSDERHSKALHVDRLLGSREIVVKSLGMHFSKVSGVSGATILGDGSVVVILDLAALIRSELAIEGPGRVNMLGAPDEAEVRKAEGPAKIMVCDDSVTVRKVTSRLLERNGMEVMLAKHGGDAIAQLIDEIPDLILLDIEMPHMDGFEVAQRVRHDERLKHIPIVMITSRTGSKHRERALSIGVNEYLGKPFQEGPLLETIERLLAER